MATAKQGQDVTQLKLPIALVIAIMLQTGGFVYTYAQQSQTIKLLEEDVAELTSRVAAEEQFNLKRDVAELKEEIDELGEVDDRLDTIDDVLDTLIDFVDVLDSDLSSLYAAVYSDE